MDENHPSKTGETLVDIHGLGPAIFGESAPSARTLRTLTRKGVLPHFRIGKLVRYDPRMVRLALQHHCLVNPKRLRANPEAR